MSSYDVLVCGAGPSGSSCARALARKGLSVALVEKDALPRDKPCGGGLRPAIIDENPYIGSGLKGIEHVEGRRIVLYSNHVENSVAYRQDDVILYGVRRYDFDAMMADAASDAGAELLTGQKVRGVEIKGGEVEIRGNSASWRAKAVVGAGGVYDPIAKEVRRRRGHPEGWARKEIGLVLVWEIPLDEAFIKDNYEEYAHHIFLSYDGLRGYAWVFPKARYLNIGYGAFWDEMRDLNIRYESGRFLKELKSHRMIPSGLPLGRFRGAPLPLRGPHQATYADRALVIGDAGGFVSPLAGDGIYYAIETGKLAAEVIVERSGEGALDERGLSIYQEMWRRRWQGEFNTLCTIADKVMEHTDKVVKYAKSDPDLLKRMVLLASGQGDTKGIKAWLSAKVAKNYVLHDVLGK